ncbi:lipoprotein-anchoring transpeptidase ErfK/SrfK [Clostridium acetobutylicum]|uniref:Uncharacterized protein, ErfK family n=1 Tax=Clostridium acetobutylicum (strain ATCC 824 / DSM 792 / JCM 1419 / IAM 19013 / LMG 5710 / NBRC 13948 / NRRL B-527 / VKM B-1787 / 2291 / W) TaxID=272562 RepID=Q97FU5_CLOAB|nr:MULTISPECIES: L,D-transpeptidase [Clostridium]AAK80578.1 Uncharacterized protein, ErfK family [Clostridium acetobutylicum ATCC 824]ADZ21677.1 Conserved hypothetical protein [Clostridium acetobutylicum EA 2018]AEI32476.1 hypothetical protein SMB_G2666 [Clostridium acetobutylicum DSM 1731]AWV79005.1 L,D-transpeptidase [Clostridium acetobutylicum]MBC2395035.1 L,D-transpeptidase [Clostridium acetobutylicum]
MIYDNYNEEDIKNRDLDIRKARKRKKKVIFIISSLVLLCLIGVLAYNEIHKYTTLGESKRVIAKKHVKKQKKKEAVPAKSTTVTQPSNQNDASSNTAFIALNQAEKPLRIDVDLEKQRVNIYDAKSRLVNSFVCSSGMNGYDTPKGEYTIKERGYSFYSQKYNEGAYYWVQFMGNYLFHSVPFDKNKNIEPNEVNKLGNKASHGCIRLPIDNAKWIYDNIPRGTLVNIK